MLNRLARLLCGEELPAGQVADLAERLVHRAGHTERMNSDALLLGQPRHAGDGFPAGTALAKSVAVRAHAMWGSIAHQHHQAARVFPPAKFAARGNDPIQHGFRGIAASDRKSTRLNSSHVKISY